MAPTSLRGKVKVLIIAHEVQIFSYCSMDFGTRCPFSCSLCSSILASLMLLKPTQPFIICSTVLFAYSLLPPCRHGELFAQMPSSCESLPSSQCKMPPPTPCLTLCVCPWYHFCSDLASPALMASIFSFQGHCQFYWRQWLSH
jgi:hypothetical protein